MSSEAKVYDITTREFVEHTILREKRASNMAILRGVVKGEERWMDSQGNIVIRNTLIKGRK